MINRIFNLLGYFNENQILDAWSKMASEEIKERLNLGNEIYKMSFELNSEEKFIEFSKLVTRVGIFDGFSTFWIHLKK